YPVVDVIDEVDAQRVWDRLRREPGVIRRTETRRTLLTDGFAQHVVGVLAEATAEQLEQRQARGEDVVEGDEVPQYGLELALDDQLEGSELLRYGLGPPDADLQVVIAEGQTDPSRPVGTTIDTTVQRAVEAALDGIDRPAGMVVVDAADGAIRASASRPLHAYNRVFAGRYPPGSTFKIVTAEALLAAGALADDEVGCPAETIVGGLRIPNAEGVALGATTLRDAFAFSCNTTFGALAADLGADAMTAAAERFGFSTTPNVPLDVFGGAFPMPRDAAETAAAAFGQARVEASVLHMASVAAATIDGTWDRPYLIADDGPGQPSPLASGVADQLRAFLRAAVADGSGRAAAIDGLDVAGKTGTAQATGGVEHAWFVGTFDNLGFAVLVEDGGSGGAVAAPIAARFITAYAQATGQLEATTSVDGDDPGDPQEDDR
ncbi:MAG: penicillin-binding transpeptidase domain-containing protein, partial [Nitriliruptoraceae bacterium]